MDRVENGRKRVAVIGAGLVGSLQACLLAKRGYDVHLYEFRKDIRTLEHVPGRSINLAMSVRGRAALRAVGVEGDIIASHGIPMRARMIHDKMGGTREIPYDRNGQSIYSVGRRHVNEVLLNCAATHDNVTCHFEHRLTAIDVTSGDMTFVNPASKNATDHSADLIVGCDGAYSAVRKQLLKRAHFNYSQQYIGHGYMELCIPADGHGEFAMPANFLHIWPRGQFMMIALPNQDKSWTVTLFMPFEIFDRLTTPQQLLAFFNTNYPDAVPLLGEQRLVADFFGNKAQPMISVKCSPYHVGSSCVILGDAAHAMVPFYGQGMNCGMEDCMVLDELFEQYDDDFSQVLSAYSIIRNPDAEAIVDLAMYNYVEMRDLVNSRGFLLRKKVDNLLYTLFPRLWVPLYTMVTFTRKPYHQCWGDKLWQDKVLQRVSTGATVAVAVSSAVGGALAVYCYSGSVEAWYSAALAWWTRQCCG